MTTDGNNPRPARPNRSWVPTGWVWLSLIPFGPGACVPVYAGVRARARTWIALGLLWVAAVVAAFVINASTTSGQHGTNDLAGFLFLASWVGGIATSFAVRGAYAERMSSPLLAATEAGEQRLRERRRALQLARDNPALAREMGIGRPDRAGSADAGLVDVNNASIGPLLTLPGVSEDIAGQIIETRRQTGGFSSLEDLGLALDLDGDVVEGLRGLTVFLPRTDG